MTDKTIIVYETKSFDSLPKETQKMIKSLSDEFNVKQLNVFNPLVEAMATIEGFTELIYKPDDETCIEQYKEAKKFFGSFNSSTKKTKSKLKKPILETGRKLDTIEKTFLGRAKEIWESVDEEFKPYLEEKERLKAEADERKNKAQIDKIKELSEQQTDQAIIIERNNIYSKHNKFIQNMLDVLVDKIDTYSEKALNIELETIQKTILEIPQEDINLLFEDQVETLNLLFERMKATCLRMVNMRIVEITQEKQVEQPEAPTVDFIVKSTMKEMTFAQAFIEIMNKAVEDVKLLPPTNEKEVQAKTSIIGGLQGYLLKILNFLDDENKD